MTQIIHGVQVHASPKWATWALTHPDKRNRINPMTHHIMCVLALLADDDGTLSADPGSPEYSEQIARLAHQTPAVVRAATNVLKQGGTIRTDQNGKGQPIYRLAPRK